MNPYPQAPEPIGGDPGRPMLGRLCRLARPVLWVYWACLAAGTHWPNLMLTPPGAETHPLGSILKVDILLHGSGFGGLMLLLILSGLGGRSRPWIGRCTVALAIGFVYAMVDELTQHFIPGRSVTLSDLVINYLAMLGVYLIAILPSRREPAPRSRALLWTFVAAVPVLLFLALSPWAMQQMIQMRTLLIGHRITHPHPYDYMAHGVLAAVVSVMVIVLWPMSVRHPRPSAVAAMLIMVLAGPGIEVLQYFTDRGVEEADATAHGIGVLLAMMWWARRLASSPELHAAGDRAIARCDEVGTSTSVVAGASDGDGDSHLVGAIDSEADEVLSAKPQAAGPPRFVGHAVLVSALTLVSRFTGLARDAVLAAALGLSVSADAFFIGFLVPNLFRRLFGEGALTAAFIPNYTELLERDPTLAKRFATLTFTLLSVFLVGLTLLAELALWWLASTIDEGHKASLAIYYTRLMLPYMPLICVVALIGGVLQVHKRFGPPAAAPLVLNGMMVLAVLLANGFFAGDTDAGRVATWVAVSVLIAGAVQLLWQVVVLLRVSGMTRSFVGCGPAMRSMLLMMLPMIIGLAVFQINSLMDSLIAFFFAPTAGDPGGSITLFGQTFVAPLRNGDVAALNWSQRLYQFPLGVFGIAIATAIFPALSSAAAKFANNSDGDKADKPKASEEFASIVRHGMRLTVFIGLPASVGLILVSVPLSRTVFEHGGFKTGDALRVSAILTGYAASVWAYSMTHTLTRAFYALKDATTPLKVSACMVALNITLNLSLIWVLGAAGLAWSTAISAAGQVVLLLWLISRRVDKPINAGVLASWRRTALASLAMAGVLLPITLLADPTSLSWWGSAGLLTGMVLLGAAVVLGVAKLAGAEELSWLRKRSVR